MGEHFKQVYLSTTIDGEKKYSVSQQCDMCNILFYAKKITERVFIEAFVYLVYSFLRDT